MDFFYWFLFSVFRVESDNKRQKNLLAKTELPLIIKADNGEPREDFFKQTIIIDAKETVPYRI